MMERFLLTHPWIPALVWAALFCGDYYLTLVGAKLRNAQTVFTMEGSYELTPQYQNDIDSARKLSPRFATWLILGAAMLLLPLAFKGSVEDWLWPYGMLIGGFVVPQVAVYVRHIGNIAMYRDLLSNSPGVTGNVRMTRSYLYSRSAVELGMKAAMVAVLFAATLSPILLGGTIGLVSLARQHHRLAKGQKAQIEQTAPAENSEMVTTNDRSN